jgi:hypothetical protein
MAKVTLVCLRFPAVARNGQMEDIQITNETVSGLSQLCAEFGFSSCGQMGEKERLAD